MRKGYLFAAIVAIPQLVLAADLPQEAIPKSIRINIVLAGWERGKSIPSSGVTTLGRCGKGVCFSVDLPSDRAISSVKYSCDGPACAQIHPCPDGGLCASIAYDFDPQRKDKPYKWFAWTDSSLPAVATYQINFVEPTKKAVAAPAPKDGKKAPK